MWKMDLMPRQSGKTTQLLEMYEKDKQNSCLIVLNLLMKNYLHKTTDKNIVTIDNFLTYNYTTGRRISNLYIDEYLLFNEMHQKELYKLCCQLGIKNIYIKTSYDVYITNLIKKFRKIKDDLNGSFFNRLMKRFGKNTSKEDEHLYNENIQIGLYNLCHELGIDNVNIETSYEDWFIYLIEKFRKIKTDLYEKELFINKIKQLGKTHSSENTLINDFIDYLTYNFISDPNTIILFLI